MGEKQKEKIIVEPEEGSPRKDFSIMGLLTKEEVKEEVKPSVEDDDIMIVSESITKQPPSAKRAIMRPPSQPRSSIQTSVPYSTTASSQYGQYSGAPLQPQLAQTYPYGSTVIQYPYGYSTGMLGVPISMADSSINPKMAVQALKAKTKLARKQRLKESFRVPLDRKGSFQHAQDTFVNEVEAAEELTMEKSNPPVYGKSEPSTSNPADKKGPHIMFNLFSEDSGFSAESSDITALWRMVFDAVSAARAENGVRTNNIGSLG